MKGLGAIPVLPPLRALAIGALGAAWAVVVQPGASLVCALADVAVHSSPLLLPALAARSEHRARGSVLSSAGLGALASRASDKARRTVAGRHPAMSLLSTVVGLAAVARAALAANEGLARTMRFNRKMVPLAIEYNFYRWLLEPASAAERKEIFGRLHARHAPEVLEAIYELRGFFVKIGQVISSFGDSFVPEAYVEALQVLQDAVPAQPGSYVRRLVESELGAPVEDLFSRFDLEKPLGAASIGQVHAATLRNGLEVVVKLQYPDAERFFRNDIRCLKGFCRVFSPENVELMEEIEKQFVTEFDYRLEAALLRQAATNLMPHFPKLVVPLPIDGEHPFNTVRHTQKGGLATLCTERCLVMERLHGTSLLAAQKSMLERQARATNTTAEQLRREMEAKFKAGQLHKSLLPSAFVIDLYAQVVHAATAFRNVGNALQGKPLKRAEPPINAPRLIDLLFDCHGHQLLHDGFFNGDPHPGNILLLDDGRVGLIDWGQVKRIGREERIKLAKLLIALADRDQVLSARWWAHLACLANLACLTFTSPVLTF